MEKNKNQKPKLIKNSKVEKLSREKSTVKAALQRALADSHREGWKKVIIIGNYDKVGYRLRHTTESDCTLLGMIEIAKALIYKDA